jgi:hypothetical protein
LPLIESHANVVTYIVTFLKYVIMTLETTTQLELIFMGKLTAKFVQNAPCPPGLNRKTYYDEFGLMVP